MCLIGLRIQKQDKVWKMFVQTLSVFIKKNIDNSSVFQLMPTICSSTE
jgi:hypothetical protein